MTQAMDNLRDCKERSKALEERLAHWRERYQEYVAMLAEFRLRQQEFDFLMAAWEQEHRDYKHELTREAPPNGKARKKKTPHS